ncbi:type II toxin-antitoxin system RelE/ParE family toxin [Paraneptunicella aestuarii]|uniref:type II toxin-antitoxin system RelE family toxin n=1 Tax=Paraneptunicella aestuarii TaxID=2831148 RepID=UPI0038CDC942|nr:type II toxin-antitoxin system RelE/ParE family toxin [Paraneptunicella aestuarii]
MDPYRIVWKKSASKELRKLERKHISSIITAIEGLAANPFPAGNKKLIGSEHTFRIRVLNYRVIYSVENNELLIEVIRVGHRKDVYRVKS